MKKIISLLMLLLMLISVCPVVGLAKTTELYTIEELEKPLTLTASGTSSIYIDQNGASWTVLFATGTDEDDPKNAVFNAYTFSSVTTLTDGQWISYKGICHEANTMGKYLKYSMTGTFIGSGNIMSLAYKDSYTTQTVIDKDYLFYFLFCGCIGLIEAPLLPATTLTEGCYHTMFNGCHLTKAPLLPATKLEKDCYNKMFSACSTLLEPSELPADELAPGCYQGMYSGCYNFYIDEYDKTVTNQSLILKPNDSTRTDLADDMFYLYFMGMTFNQIKRPDGNTPYAVNGKPCNDKCYYLHDTVRIDSAIKDYVSVNHKVAASGTEVEVKVLDKSGYELTELYYVKGTATDHNEITKSGNKYSFIMPGDLDLYPNDYVTVYASFEEITQEPIVSGGVSSEPRIAPADKVIPTIYIGEDRSEIKVLTLDNYYESESNSFSAIAPIIIENNRTFLGVRDMANVLGIAPEAIKWNEKTKTATISKSGAVISITQGSKDISITYGGYIYTKHNDVSAINRNDRIYLPFRVIFQLFGYSVNWDNETRIITCK